MKFNDNLIAFFKKHNIYDEKMFDYLSKHAVMIDYQDEDQRPFIGCFYAIDKNHILNAFQVNVPYVFDDITMLISIHELVHGIVLYKYLNKKFKRDITIESLPLLYERLYILEHPNDKLLNYGNYLDSKIDSHDNEEYAFGLSIREKLLDKYDYNLNKMHKMVKKLARKYHRKSK